MRAIDSKLYHEIRGLSGQIVTIALVLASGIASFLMLTGTHASIERSRDAFYDRYGFADVFVTLERAPETLARRVEALPGVRAVETRIKQAILLPREGLEKPAYSTLLSLPRSRKPATNALLLERGRFPEPGRVDEVVLLEAFAEAHDLRPGSEVSAVINGTLRKLRVTGIARSPEYVYAVMPGAYVADPKRCAVLWMDRSALASAFSLEGAFNELSLRLQPGASTEAVRAAVDRLLLPYGGNGAILRKDQLSNRIVNGELDQLGGIANLVPLVFLGVTVFLMRLVLGRLITLQRSEIATLKAIGYSNREVGLHYLGLVAVVILPGGALGVALGWVFGNMVTGLYLPTFRFPDLAFRLSSEVVALALLSSFGAAGAGGWLAVRAGVRLPPAEAMRPPSPARYRKSLVERLGLATLMGPAGLMILREVARRPLKTAMSSLGVAGAVSLVVLGRFGMDSVDHYLDENLRPGHRQDLSVTFTAPVPPRAVGELARTPGVLAAEGMRAVPIRVKHEHRERDSVLLGLPSRASLRRLVQRDGRIDSVPQEGVLLTKTLGELLGLRVGDRVSLELRDGRRLLASPVVSGFIDEAAGLQVYARSEIVNALERDSGAISAVLLQVDPLKTAAVTGKLVLSPHALQISEIREEIGREREQHRSVFNVWTSVSVLLGSAVVFGVVYNNARISLVARARELGSLRVLGFTRREISLILIGGIAIDVALAIPVGLVIGGIWADQLMSGIDKENFRWSGMVSGRTYALATFVPLLSAAVSALWVRRSLDRLDLVAVLKTKE